MGYLGIKPANSPLTSELIPDGIIGTSDIADVAVTPAKMSQKLTSGTAVASTSGTSIDFTGIPSWVKRITVMFNGVSTNGSSNLQVQIGDSGGIENTSYSSSAFGAPTGNAITAANSTAGYLATSFNNAAYVVVGSLVITNISGNIWVNSGSLGTTTTVGWSCGGSKELSATLDRIRITTVNGTDTFDLGSINIMYEG